MKTKSKTKGCKRHGGMMKNSGAGCTCVEEKVEKEEEVPLRCDTDACGECASCQNNLEDLLQRDE